MCFLCAICAYTNSGLLVILLNMSELKKSLEQTTFIPSTVGFLVRDDEVLLGLRKKVSHGLGLI